MALPRLASVLVLSQWLGIEELDVVLHDAYLDLKDVGPVGRSVVIPGKVVQLGKRWPFPLTAKHLIELRFEEVDDFTFEDHERIEMLIVHDVAYREHEGVLVLNGAIPGRVIVRTRKRGAYLHIADDPIEVRRWGRWRPVT